MEPVYVASPSLDPRTVTLADPVTAELLRCTRLPTAQSNVVPSVLLPDRVPIVMIEPRLPRSPCPNWHLTDVSDAQVVCSLAVDPALTPRVDAAGPMLAPCIDKIADPVATELARSSALAELMSAE